MTAGYFDFSEHPLGEQLADLLCVFSFSFCVQMCYHDFSAPNPVHAHLEFGSRGTVLFAFPSIHGAWLHMAVGDRDCGSIMCILVLGLWFYHVELWFYHVWCSWALYHLNGLELVAFEYAASACILHDAYTAVAAGCWLLELGCIMNSRQVTLGSGYLS